MAIGDKIKGNTFSWEANKKYDTVKDNSIYTIFDTSTSGLLISKDYYDSLIFNIKKESGLNEVGDILSNCDGYPTLWFMFDSRWVEISREDYVFEDDSGDCLLNIFPIDIPFNVFGTAFFADYYSVFDTVKGTLSLAPHTRSSKKSLRSGISPSKKKFIEVGGPDEKEISSSSFWISWVACISLAIAVVVYFNANYSMKMRK